MGEVKYSCSGDVSAPRVLWWAFELGIEQDIEQDIELGIEQDIEQEMTIALTMTILPASMVIPITIT